MFNYGIYLSEISAVGIYGAVRLLATEFISISTILRKAPTKYAKAYLYTETDNQDTAYFVDYSLRIILRAIDVLHKYLSKKAGEMQDVEQLLVSSNVQYSLNHRQISLLDHVVKHAGNTYTIQSHMASHNITYQTSRTDLLGLADVGLLQKLKLGRTFVFKGVDDIRPLLQNMAK